MGRIEQPGAAMRQIRLQRSYTSDDQTTNPNCFFFCAQANQICNKKQLKGLYCWFIQLLIWLFFLYYIIHVYILFMLYYLFFTVSNLPSEQYQGAGGHVTHTQLYMLFNLSGGWTQVGPWAPEEITQQADLHAATDARKRPPRSSWLHERQPAY